MKPSSLLCALLAANAQAGTLEGLKASSEAQFLSTPALPPKAPLKPQTPPETEEPAFEEPLIQDPRLKPLPPSQAQGAVVGRANLAPQLDRHRDLLPRQLGPSLWNISAAGDAAFKNVFLTFEQKPKLVIAPLGDLDRLRGEGVDVAVAPGVTYNFRIVVNIFDPVRGSTLKITPVRGTQGPRHDVKTGVVLDAVKARSFVFSSGGVEYWMLYGTDVDPATNTLAKTRSLLFIREAGLSSKAWPVAETSLPVGQPTSATFGDQSFVLTRTAEGELLIQRP